MPLGPPSANRSHAVDEEPAPHPSGCPEPPAITCFWLTLGCLLFPFNFPGTTSSPVCCPDSHDLVNWMNGQDAWQQRTGAQLAHRPTQAAAPSTSRPHRARAQPTAPAQEKCFSAVPTSLLFVIPSICCPHETLPHVSSNGALGLEPVEKTSGGWN